VEVARNQTLYRQEYSRGLPQAKLTNEGKVHNRRGTRVRFKPDEQIFGKGAKFKPARLFKMARSKAYLFRRRRNPLVGGPGAPGRQGRHAGRRPPSTSPAA
jgi:DNA gyrase/topoisomerase IV subunit B